MTRPRLALATIGAKNVVPHVRVLAESLGRAGAGLDTKLFFALTDQIDGRFSPHEEPFELVPLDDLPFPASHDLRFRYGRFQLAVAAKPFVAQLLLDRGFRSVLLLDPDVLVLGELEPLFREVERHTLTLVPHFLEPPPGEEGIERELAILRTGTYNGGVVGVSASAGGERFVRWWGERLAEDCAFDPERAMHFDQRWLDLASSFVADTHVVRDPGVNVAHWNLRERPIAFGEGITAAGVPCRIFHFSGFDPSAPGRASRYSSLGADELGDARALFERYREALLGAGWDEAQTWSYAFGAFDNGLEIPQVARDVYGALDGRERFGDPFEAERPGSYLEWLRERPAGARNSRLWRAVWERRHDLQVAFPNPDGADARAFAAWTSEHGTEEHGIAPALL